VRGFFGIGIEAGKTPENVGGLWRSAHAFGASFIFTVGHRYPQHAQATDTTKAWKSIPLIEYRDCDALLYAKPRDCELVGVDCGYDDWSPVMLPKYAHPERAIYVLGAEDRGLSSDMLECVTRLIEIPGDYCLNVATAGSVVMYDRAAKSSLTKHSPEER
jgi:tRNA G18 (ribose-2'-O)-methylase SpoU